MRTIKNLSGERFSKLIVLCRVSNKNGRVRWKCKCKCGRIKIIWACNLRTKSSKSCGYCIRQKKNNPCWKGCGELGGRQFGGIISGAKERNITFGISIRSLWRLFIRQNRKCSLSGIKLSMDGWENGRNYNGTASVDRIDSAKGYIKGNVQWVHKDVNFMKQDFSQEEFLNYCRLITKEHE